MAGYSAVARCYDSPRDYLGLVIFTQVIIITYGLGMFFYGSSRVLALFRRPGSGPRVRYRDLSELQVHSFWVCLLAALFGLR